MIEKTYTWPFSLHENAMTKDDETDFLASVRVLQTFSIEDIAKEVIRRGTEYSPETLVGVFRLMEEAIRRAVYAGNRVQTSLARYSPSISGVFDRTGSVEPQLHKSDIRITPTADFLAGLDHIKLVYNGNLHENGGAKIVDLIDLTTRQKTDTFTPSSLLCLRGHKIKCINADGSGIGRLVLTDCTTGKEHPVERIVENYPKRLTFQFPPGLPAGEYTLSIETYYTTGVRLLRKPRVITYLNPLSLLSE